MSELNARRLRKVRVVLMTLVIVAMVGTVLVLPALGQPDADQFTGCLDFNGKITDVAVGDTPLKPCKVNEKHPENSDLQITWSATGPQGPQGEPGIEGPPGEQGPQGEPGISGYEVVTSEVFEVPYDSWLGDQTTGLGEIVLCPDGKRVLGGGFSVLDGFSIGEIRTSAPDLFGEEGWRVSLFNDSPVDGLRVQLYATCAFAGESSTSTTHHLAEADSGATISGAVGDTIVLSLDGNPTTGFQWDVDIAVGLTLLDESFDPDPCPGTGCGGTYMFRFEVTGDGELLMVYHRTWSSDPPLRTFHVTIET